MKNKPPTRTDPWTKSGNRDRGKDSSPAWGATIGRRQLLGGLGLVALSGALGGCKTPQARADYVRVPKAELPPGTRKVVQWRDQPVEIIHTADGVSARSLICTHMSCIVRWDEAERLYICPCHDGRFDAAGRPVSGPPLESLQLIPVSLETDHFRVGSDESPA